MKWSFKLARIAGIDVMIHWTFAILLFWLATANLIQGKGIVASALGLAFVLAIFTCVVLHEFGHALVARRFGIKTPDITLLPIGGVARLERIPEDPKQEFLIAIAGPLVNVVIALILLAGLLLTGGFNLLTNPDQSWFGGGFWVSLLLVNIFLVVFNLIPAFPMDGGRVLRAILATNMSHVRATEIAANIGQVIAICFGVIGLFTNWFLIFIALFIYIGAQAEAHLVLTRSMLEGVRVRDAMMTRFVVVGPHDPVSVVVEELLAGDQQDFPVVEGDRVLGILRKNELIEAIANGKPESEVSSVMQTDCLPVSESDMLRDAFEAMQQAVCSTLPVYRDGRLVGLLTQANVAEWLMIQSAMHTAAERFKGYPDASAASIPMHR